MRLSPLRMQLQLQCNQVTAHQQMLSSAETQQLQRKKLTRRAMGMMMRRTKTSKEKAATVMWMETLTLKTLL